jgi:Uncharacterized protein conserved in bacteria
MTKALFYSLLFFTFSDFKCLSGQEQSITGYDLSNPEKFNLPESLLEISGISFYKGKADTIYAIQDEQGHVYRLAWNERKQQHTRFAKQGDYEDITIIRDRVYVLKSNGTIFSFPFNETTGEEASNVREWKNILPKGEYEGMWGDENDGRLYVICKNCKDDNNKKKISGYVIQTGDSLFQSGEFSVNVEQIRKLNGKVKKGFRPSAIAKHPVTGDWFIVSAVNKILVVADSNWDVKEVCRLNGNDFNQPEGIAFDENRNLYISSEGDDLSEGYILKFVPTGS